MSDTSFSDASVAVLVDGTEMEGEDKDRLKFVEVVSTADGPDSFSVLLFNQSPDDWVKFPSGLSMGAEVEIKLGYDGSPETIFTGLISRIEARFPDAQAPTYRVSGYCKLQLLARPKLTKVWEAVKYEDVVSELAGIAGLGVDSDSTSLTMDHIGMQTQSPLAFITDLARRVGFIVSQKDGSLLFKKPVLSGGAVATLIYGENLKKVNFRADTNGLVTEVTVFGYDSSSASQVIGKASTGDIETLAGGELGADTLKSKLIEAPYQMSGYAAGSQADVDEVAKAIINEHGWHFLECDADVEGDAAILGGTVVEFEKVTDPFNGKYYVQRAIHTYRVGGGTTGGYQTKVIGVRPDWTAP